MESTHVPWWNRVTVIVTTSPVRSNPDVSLVEEVFQSFFLVPGMVRFATQYMVVLLCIIPSYILM